MNKAGDEPTADICRPKSDSDICCYPLLKYSGISNIPCVFALPDEESVPREPGSDTSCQAIHIWRKGKSSHKISALGKGIFNTPGKVHHRNVCTKHRRGGFRIRPLLSRAPPNRARLNKQVVRQSSGFFRRGGGPLSLLCFFIFINALATAIQDANDTRRLSFRQSECQNVNVVIRQFLQQTGKSLTVRSEFVGKNFYFFCFDS